MNEKLDRHFYRRPAAESAPDFLGKVLVHQTPQGRVAGIVYDVEAYPAFSDEVHHGNKRTPRTEVLWQEGGRAYVYLIYGVWYQFGAVVNEANIPDVVFVRAAMPIEGIELMERQWDKVMDACSLTASPGKLCRSFLITKEQYGLDLTGAELFFEDWGIRLPAGVVKRGPRVGIRPELRGADQPLRFFVDPAVIDPASGGAIRRLAEADGGAGLGTAEPRADVLY